MSKQVTQFIFWSSWQTWVSVTTGQGVAPSVLSCLAGEVAQPSPAASLPFSWRELLPQHHWWVELGSSSWTTTFCTQNASKAVQLFLIPCSASLLKHMHDWVPSAPIQLCFLAPLCQDCSLLHCASSAVRKVPLLPFKVCIQIYTENSSNTWSILPS